MGRNEGGKLTVQDLCENLQRWVEKFLKSQGP
jgi:hypothetical protein